MSELFCYREYCQIPTKLWDPHVLEDKVATIEIQLCHLYNINCEHSTDAK